MKKFRFITMVLLLWLPLLGYAESAVKPLPANQVFQLAAKVGKNNTVQLQWQIKSGYYLYRNRLHFKILQPKTAKLGKLDLPPGIPREDEIFGKYQIYPQRLTIAVPIINPENKNVLLQVSYQGCSEAGYCYAPIIRKLTIDFAQQTVSMKQAAAPLSEQQKITQLLSGKHIATILLAFLGFGLLLSFTPCVLPMIPILSGIIIGHGKITTRKAFALSSVYVLGMSLTYAVAGVLIGYIGGNIHATLQAPWIIILFSFIFVLLALSLFGLYNLELPRSFEQRIANLSNKQKHGSYIGTAIMGCLATLIVSPCVTPALVGVISYISQTGNAALGGFALFATGIGMGIPLLLIGTGGSKLLPKAGPWMNAVKSALGVLLLGVAIWMLSRIIPGPVTMLLWASLLIITGIYMGALTSIPDSGWHKLWKGVGFVMLVYGVLLIIGASMGSSNLLHPIQINSTTSNQHATQFRRVKTVNDVTQALALAKKQQQPAILDFYADWCVSCKEMELRTFSDPSVKQAMTKFMLLQADVTRNDAADKALEKHYGVIAPPTLIFFNRNGKEMKNLRIVGEMGPQRFLAHLQQALVQVNNK